MSNTLTTAVLDAASQDTTTHTVVKHDNSSSRPSISLSALPVPATVTVAQSVTKQPMEVLQSMEDACKSWEQNELAASNKRLYSILRDAYRYYENLKTHTDKDVRKQHKDALDQFVTHRQYKFMPSTHDMTRVVKCVFGVDRRRVSAYSIALREALRQGVTSKDLVLFIEENGGVEQIRLGGTKPLSVTKRAAKAVDEVLSTQLGTLKFDPRLLAGDPDWIDKQVVIVATYLPTGEFQANAVIQQDSAVNAALAAYYSQQQAKQRLAAKAEREAEEIANKANKVAAEQAAKQQSEFLAQQQAEFSDASAD